MPPWFVSHVADYDSWIYDALYCNNTWYDTSWYDTSYDCHPLKTECEIPYAFWNPTTMCEYIYCHKLWAYLNSHCSERQAAWWQVIIFSSLSGGMWIQQYTCNNTNSRVQTSSVKLLELCFISTGSDLVSLLAPALGSLYRMAVISTDNSPRDTPKQPQEEKLMGKWRRKADQCFYERETPL